MIQIIAGTFGYYNGRKVVPITNADGPQKFDPELEARLVKKGVAKYVDEQPVAPAPAAKPEQEPETVPETGDAPAAPEYDEDMKLDELKEGGGGRLRRGRLCHAQEGRCHRRHRGGEGGGQRGRRRPDRRQ